MTRSHDMQMRMGSVVQSFVQMQSGTDDTFIICLPSAVYFNYKGEMIHIKYYSTHLACH